MNFVACDGDLDDLDEDSLIKLYMDLTGTSEACARSVYMFVSGDEEENNHKTNGLDRWRTEKTESQKAVMQESHARNATHSEFGIGFLGAEGLEVTGK